ncbi:MAG: bifunctional ADP-dependent NAD(P)H-hydrate dehydratase/NAD(P)H-hydrate epimerase [Bacteroidetes bacterium B1(2017)]|nr:MAG: bifunctional ADP-dependent NAD(P)H-hydrate dehydratase/NAD(P)H-hydrate epimerase [Bacteroidetes bacterium B1(2017)]
MIAPILSSSQIKQWDNYTIEQDSLTRLGLMERAATRCYHALISQLELENTSLGSKTFMVFCGQGNNGGDGLVIARHLKNAGYTVQLHLLSLKEIGSEDFELNLVRCKAIGIEPNFIQSESDFPSISKSEIVIDALFGTGLNAELSGLSLALVQHINVSNANIISIDLPSGLFADIDSSCTQNLQNVIYATNTYSFELPKSSFLFAETAKCVGDFYLVNIDLSPSFLTTLNNPWFWLNKLNVEPKSSSKFSYKWQKGHALLIGGSYGKIGAVILSAKAALRAGCGLISTFVPSVGYSIIQTAFPEAMIETDVEPNEIRNFPSIEKYSAIGIGPGLGTHSGTCKAFEKWISQLDKPCVIDADALNIYAKILSENSSFAFPKYAILTPHAKEFDRLFGAQPNSYERLLKGIEMAKKHSLIIVLKGAHTQIISPKGEVFFNATGNVLLATAGSGDVLTGIITSYLAQGYSPIDAALKGVFTHGHLADSLKNKGHKNCIASDFIEELKYH